MISNIAAQRQKGGGKQIEKEEEPGENEKIMGWYALKHFKFARKPLMKKQKNQVMTGLGGDDFLKIF